MAAVPEARAPEIVHLGQIRSGELEPMLREETRAWRQQLDWDFRSSADLVRRFVDVRALNGYALLVDGRVAGYSYSVSEEHKGLIGDLYVVERFRTAENEHRLLGAVVRKLMDIPYIRRIESQLMLLGPGRPRPAPASEFLKTFDRQFMIFELSALEWLKPRSIDGHVMLDLWTERRQDECAHVIAAAYRGHIDSAINDQYRSVAGARRFLYNIVQYPGCGTFFAAGSWLAVDRATNRVCGLCLSNLVAAEVGHITQVCVTPAVQGTGLGYELLRQSLGSLAQAGARRVSLTVTSANTVAIRLYERMGFTTLRRFPALVWEGF